MVEGFQKRREMPGNMFVEEYALMLTWARLGHDHLRPLWAPHASKRDEAAALHDAYLERANTRARLAALED